jgi:RNA polymerase sigma factor (sigma-70 family)
MPDPIPRSTSETPSEESRRASFLAAVSQHLSRLYEFVRHELEYRSALGDVRPNELTPEDVVDAAILRAYSHFVKGKAPHNLGPWLMRLALERLALEVAQRRAEDERTVHIEEDVPETPPNEYVSTLGDEILDFYEPEEDLKLEDLVPDPRAPSPEREAENAEARRRVRHALAAMPRTWRRALLLSHIEGLSPAELAPAFGRSESDMKHVLERARERVRRKLVESGCRSEGGSRG